MESSVIRPAAIGSISSGTRFRLIFNLPFSDLALTTAKRIDRTLFTYSVLRLIVDFSAVISC